MTNRTITPLSSDKAMKVALIAVAVASVAIASFANNMSAAYAQDILPKFDVQGDSPIEDFDIKQYFFDSDGNPVLQMYGHAGRTVPEHHMDVYAYVIVTDTGIFATDSHEAQHADDEQVTNKAWHGHKVEVDSQGCLTEIGSFKASVKMAGTNVKLIGTDASKILAAQTVMLELQVEDPDNPPEGVTCIAKIMQVFDTAVLA